jgi:hypothetical protein
VSDSLILIDGVRLVWVELLMHRGVVLMRRTGDLLLASDGKDCVALERVGRGGVPADSILSRRRIITDAAIPRQFVSVAVLQVSTQRWLVLKYFVT